MTSGAEGALPSPTRKAELVEHIRGYLEGDGLRAVWERLDDLQKAAVAEVVHSPGTAFSPRRFHAKYVRLPDFGTVRRHPRHDRPTPLRFFLFFIGGGEGGGGVMPDDLKERLQEFVPAPVGAKVESLEQLPAAHDRPFKRWNRETRDYERGTEAVPLVVRESARAAERELFSVLRLVDAGKVAVSEATRRPSASTVEAITALLDGGDYYSRPTPSQGNDDRAGPIRAFAWPLLVQAVPRTSTPAHSMAGANRFQNASTSRSSSSRLAAQPDSFLTAAGAARIRWHLYGVWGSSSASVLN
jgi:hypothetical protein